MQNLKRGTRNLAIALGLASIVVCGGCQTNPPQIYMLDRGYIAESMAREAYLGQTSIEEPKPIPQIAIKF